MKDSYGYRHYRGSRARRRGFLINALLAVAIAAAALWVLCLLLPLDEDGLRFPGQGDGPAAADTLDNQPDADSGTENGDTPDSTDPSAENGDTPDTTDPAAESGDAPDSAEPPAQTGSTQGSTIPSTSFSAFPRKNAAKVDPRWSGVPEQPKNNRMVLLTASEFVGSADRLLALYQSGTITGAVVTVKDERGILYYPSAIPEVQGQSAILQPVAGLPEAVASLRAAGMPLTAVMYTHCDDRRPRRDESIALQNINGIGWRDGALRIYLDPANDRATAYLTTVAQELEALGFRELLLRGLGYPTDGWLARISYPEDRFGTVTGFVSALREAVPDTRVSVWLDTPALAANDDNGQSVRDLYEVSSRVFADVPGDADGGPAALVAWITAAAGGDGKLVAHTGRTDTALPALLLELPLDALGG